MLSLNWSNVLDNGTFEGELAEGLAEIVIWAIGLKMVTWVINHWAVKQPWFKDLDKRPGGVAEWVACAKALPNHTMASFLVFVGYLTGNLALIRSGTLVEFGYESVDLLTFYYNYWTTPMMHNAEGRHLLLLLTTHHLPGILVIIPANLYLAHDIYFQKIVNILLVPTVPLVPVMLICKILDLHDLRQRTQFTVLYIFHILAWLASRIYYWHLFCLQYYFNTVITFDPILQVVCLFYYLVLSWFNFDCSKMLLERLYRYCFIVETESDLIKESKAMQNFAFERRLKKALADLKHESEKTGSPHAKFIKTPFRRTTTEPIFKND